MRLTRFFCCFAWLLLAAAPLLAGEPFLVTPAQVELCGRFDRAQLLAAETDEQGKITERSRDLTATARYESANPAIVQVAPGGRLQAVGNGETTIRITVNGHTQETPVRVHGVGQTPVDYTRDVRPILNKAGCATAACHAAQHGKGGFKLSVFGFDPEADFDALARNGRQRRVNLANPELSLLLRKPSMQVAHGGGLRLERKSVEFATLRQWIAEGTTAPAADSAEAVSITVTPSARWGKVDMVQQLQVTAHYSDGTTRDVTPLAKFDSLDEGVIAIDDQGRAAAVASGQTAVMVRYESQAEICTFVIPYGENVQLAGWQSTNFIDELAEIKFRELGIEPSPLCDDAAFVRRAFFDAIGTLPTAAEAAAFIDSTEPNKRAQLIDRLLGLTGDPQQDLYNDQYAAYWTLKWSDLIRNNSQSLGEQGMWSLHNWIRESFRTNRPFDEFVQELVTAKGSIYSSGPANFFRIHSTKEDLTEATAQLFLGVRLECAKCHHHPFEKYSQADYYGLSAFFSRVGSKRSEEFGLFGNEQIIMVRPSGDVRHPVTKALLPPTPLGGTPMEEEPLDRRVPLAEWLTSTDNDFFAKSIANRYMGYLLGSGLVEPIDDMRSTNPPSNVALMNALGKSFVDSGFDLKQLMRTIMNSRLYQLSSQPTPGNLADTRFYSHFLVKRIPAEPLLDAIDRATGAPTKFKNLPLGVKAIELPDAEYPNYFLQTFSKPKRVSVCECERSPEESLAQALHTLNGDTVADKIAGSQGRIAQLVKAKTPHAEIVTELYLATLSRRPSPEELAFSDELLADSDKPQTAYEDLLWALINSKQFLFVR
ncbi:DUF1549 and DUF1553 domain-containing protein [Lignipirellula cremea]|uniref:Bacterial Ig-like domain (Group 2) n=1 Tax=Lignipirellula cremea TaxID=2528010 RepID=A0A518DP18_9BACT|nr:DUF1549 and DUF1553 domain-containing protein [Lignipirellula cremea]QDU93588.1 Bacterial Ig-like domain (group 2) [Lignipirellula cremea]